MDIQQLNHDLITILEQKIVLNALDYNSQQYDEVEEKLHDMEDSLLEQYGDFLEGALHEVHDELCPDTEVLLPIAYLPRFVTKNDSGFQISTKDGVFVEVDDYEGNDTKLILLPNPVRIELIVDSEVKETVWQP